MGLLCGTHMGPIWATRIWDNPYGTHAEPGCTPHMGPIWVAHLGPIYACLLGLRHISLKLVYECQSLQYVCKIWDQLSNYKT